MFLKPSLEVATEGLAGENFLTGKISGEKIIVPGNQNVSSVRCHFSKISLTWPIKVVEKSKPSER